MIVIRVAVEIQETAQERVIAHMKDEVQAVRSLAGCVRYEFFQDVHECGKFLLYEEWNDLESFRAYKQSQRFTDTGKVLFPALVGKPDSAYYRGESIPISLTKSCV
jgi:quinol monooxygenase YgiN